MKIGIKITILCFTFRSFLAFHIGASSKKNYKVAGDTRKQIKKGGQPFGAFLSGKLKIDTYRCASHMCAGI